MTYLLSLFVAFFFFYFFFLDGDACGEGVCNSFDLVRNRNKIWSCPGGWSFLHYSLIIKFNENQVNVCCKDTAMRCVCWHVFSHARYNCMLLQHKLNVKLLLVTLVMHLWVVASWHSIYGFLCNITAVSVLDVQMKRVIQGYQFITAVYLSPLARNSPIKSDFKRQIRLPGCKFLFLTPMRCKVIFRLIFAWWFQYDWVFFFKFE